MARQTYIDRIKNLGSCAEAIDWLHKSGHRSLRSAWTACPRGDWLDWLIVECDPQVRKARAACSQAIDQAYAAYSQAHSQAQSQALAACSQAYSQARAAYADSIRIVHPKPPRLVQK